MLTREIARRALALSWSDLPDGAIFTAKQAILDTVGVTLAGSLADCTRLTAKALGCNADKGEALIFGTPTRTDALNAALINGTASHALDFDDCSNTLGGHPSAPILPGLWALAERRRSGGQELLIAYIIGVEVETKLGRAVNFHHYEKGWHPTATLGVFGAAASCAHLMNLNEERFATALAIAASMAAGLKVNFGTMTKPYHVGHASRNGLLAALLAAEGLSANEAALEDPQGFFAVFNGAGTFESDRILDEWAAPLDILDPGIAFKRHPCCASTHPAADAILRLRDAGLRANDVDRIQCWTHPRRLNHTNRPDPRTGLDAKFSVQYVIARALMDGVVSLTHFTDDAIGEPEVRALLQNVDAQPDPHARMDTAEHFYARVRVQTKSGEVLESFVDRPVGRDRDHPLPNGALEAKFMDCARQVQDDRSTQDVLKLILTLEHVDRISQISELLAVGSSEMNGEGSSQTLP